jgi:glyoxylase-like metal-dependent hydrolase (beta-lactamase superfamily II)
MSRLWGNTEAVPENRVKILADGEVVRLGDLEIRAHETLGHASHHHVYQWDESIFGGDIAGVRIGNGPPVPPFVPPELDIEAWLASIEKIRLFNPRALFLPHFGLVPGSISSHLDGVAERVRRWSQWFLDRLQEGENEEGLIPLFAKYEAADLQAGGASESDVFDYEAADPSYMAVTAALRYWRKREGTLGRGERAKPTS